MNQLGGERSHDDTTNRAKNLSSNFSLLETLPLTVREQALDDLHNRLGHFDRQHEPETGRQALVKVDPAGDGLKHPLLPGSRLGSDGGWWECSFG